MDNYNSKIFVAKCVNIRKDQNEFLTGERKGFKLSKFVQSKLDDYIKFRSEFKMFMEETKDEKK